MAQIESRGPLIGGVTWFLCFFCGVFLALRVYAKLSRHQKLWWDDWILIFSWTCLLAESIITQLGINIGFGRHYYDIDPPNLMTIAMYTSIGASISCFASTGSKVGFGVTLLRLTTDWYRIFVWFAVVTLTVIMLPSATLTWLKCTPVQKNFNSQMEGTCWDKSITLNYGILNAAWCAAMDFLLALVPWKLIWGMRMRKHEKIGICVAMSLGWLSGVCAIIKGVYLVQLEMGDFFYNGKDVTIWTAVETTTAIVASSIPVLRVFVREKASTRGYNNNRSDDSNGVALNTYRGTVKSTVTTISSKTTMPGGSHAEQNTKAPLRPMPEIEPIPLDVIMTEPIDIEGQLFPINKETRLSNHVHTP
ncbi:hypothetical protein Cob_v008990 [Colletotrichum orbiculare MAFF 240422]|uniref:Rhodopsin domain-containing protein n=1 Tax=Colletotrichum orbiculare (strain 104-T / ATCC 96160 / CBS 514.97 / LARS 414 / MAFF 240422) TaxID=1213857 RepID=N4VXW1_COLOR|nr:hypothetical protein Cob_v008990 [Colletotrichum orbiculare MAFF 240422]